MANKWQDVMIPLLRIILQDVGTTSDYDAGRLEDVVLAASHLVQSEIDFNYTYTVDLVLGTISPDPVDNNDVNFINLVTYKAALIVLNSELKTAASNGVLIKDGPSIIDTRQFFISQKNRYDMMLKEYDKVKMQAKLGDLSAGQAIMTPFNVNNIPGYIWG